MTLAKLAGGTDGTDDHKVFLLDASADPALALIDTENLAAGAVTPAKMEDGSQGDIIIFNSSGKAERVTRGAASQILRMNATGTTPQWVDMPTFGQGTITAVTAGSGLTGGGSTGAVSLAVTAGGIGTSELEDGAVTTAKIATSAVVTAKIANNAVHTQHINADAVTQAKIADGAVGVAQLGSDAVTNVKLAHSAVDTAEIATHAVTMAKLEQQTQGDLLVYGTNGDAGVLSAGTGGQVLAMNSAATGQEWVNDKGVFRLVYSDTTDFEIEQGSGAIQYHDLDIGTITEFSLCVIIYRYTVESVEDGEIDDLIPVAAFPFVPVHILPVFTEGSNADLSFAIKGFASIGSTGARFRWANAAKTTLSFGISGNAYLYDAEIRIYAYG